jgi:hypothetical protein
MCKDKAIIGLACLLKAQQELAAAKTIFSRLGVDYDALTAAMNNIGVVYGQVNGEFEINFEDYGGYRGEEGQYSSR